MGYVELAMEVSGQRRESRDLGAVPHGVRPYTSVDSTHFNESCSLDGKKGWNSMCLCILWRRSWNTLELSTQSGDQACNTEHFTSKWRSEIPSDRIQNYHWYSLVIWLVVWNMFYFPIYWKCHHPNWLIFFRGVGQPPTSYQWTERMMFNTRDGIPVLLLLLISSCFGTEILPSGKLT